jgi:zinc/manganese transport system substrate-binding protein
MKHIVAALIVSLSLSAGSLQAKVRVFACEPEWAALAEAIGGDALSVYAATTAMQDPHSLEARPSLIAQVRRADLVICTGAGLEAGWLPLLLRRASNPDVLPGKPGFIQATDYVPLLEKPARLDRAEGDVHADGNPHVQLDPRNILRVAQALSDRLRLIDPGGEHTYVERLTDFATRWQAAITDWEQRAAPLRGMPIVVHHRAWTYLNHWLQLEEVGALEPRPGVPPTSKHLAQLLHRLEQKPARVIIRAPYQSPRASEWLAKQSGIPALVLPFTVGGNDQADDLFGLFDSTITLLLGVQP